MKNDDLKPLIALGLLFVATKGVVKGVSAVKKGFKAMKESNLEQQRDEQERRRIEQQAQAESARRAREQEIIRQAEEAREDGYVVCTSCLPDRLTIICKACNSDGDETCDACKRRQEEYEEEQRRISDD